jgi:peptidoglycan DL-endopeptidase CwlO
VAPLTVHRPVRRPLARILAGILSILAVLLLIGGGTAWANPTPTSVAQVEAQLAKLWAQVEPQIEKYNLIHEQYLKNKARLAVLQKQLEPLENEVLLGQLRAGYIAAQVYKSGDVNELNAVLVAGDAQSLVDQLTMIDAISRDQLRQLEGVVALKDRYEAQRKPLDRLVTTLAQQDKDLAARRKSIDAQIKQLQVLRVKAYGAAGRIGRLRPWVCPASFNISAGYKAAAFACSQAGKPYVWAAAGPSSYDCSGLTLRAWAQVGVYLPHNAAAQYYSMPHVSRANLRMGDLVFFNGLSHVGIYVGDGHIMQAPQPGDVVHMTDISAGGYVYGYGRPNG